jgi:3-isopropylmalate/(R)-2-methylmalate dehydratase small subunit
MRRFTKLSGMAAALPEANVDTDKILAGKFLKVIERRGLGRFLFFAQRFDDDGLERPDFVLNRPAWRSAVILVALDNFGCGSAREHAPWALADYGIRCVIAPSFAEIFQNNCYKNGILPITLPHLVVEQLLAEVDHAATAHMTIDLESQTVISGRAKHFSFEIAPEKKEQLLLGLNEIDASERLLDRVIAFEGDIAYCCPSIPSRF